MKELISRNPIQRFKQGGVKRFSVSFTNNKGKTYYFDTEKEARDFQRKQKPGTTVRRDGVQTSRGQVIRGDRSKEKATEYGRSQLESNNHLSFKQAYQKGRASGNQYFAWRGQVYKTDLQNGKNNMEEMMQHYGNRLGYSKNPKVNNTSSRKAQKYYRNTSNAQQGNRNANYIGKTNSQANAEADKNFNRNLGISTLAPDFIDAVSPQTAIGNMIDLGMSKLSGEKFIPKIYVAGYNVPGMAKDLVEENYSKAALRGLDAYLSFGAPGARVNLTPKGTNVTEGAVLLPNGTREFSKWHLKALGPNATQPMEGVLRSSKGTTYFIDNGQFIKNLTAPALVAEPSIQQAYNIEK